jgi:endonuclease-3
MLLFALGRDVFPVDTHVHRICRRVGLLPQKASAVKTHHAMQPLVPDGKAYSLHVNLLKLGRRVCRPRQPECQTCPILEWCEFGRNKTSR